MAREKPKWSLIIGYFYQCADNSSTVLLHRETGRTFVHLSNLLDTQHKLKINIPIHTNNAMIVGTRSSISNTIRAFNIAKA